MKSRDSFFGKSILFHAVAATTLLMATATVPAMAQSARVFQSIRIDMTAIPSGAAQTREDIRVCLSNGLPLAFKGRINPADRGAPVLVVRPLSIWLAPLINTPTSDETGGSDVGGGYDSMEGEALVGNQRIPLTVSAGASAGDIHMPVAVSRQRALVLCNSFIHWMARKI
jgi:hypothetical protein